MLMLQVTDIRHRLQRQGFNPQVLSDRLVVAVAHLIYGDQVEGIMITNGGRCIRIDEGELPGLVKQARGLLSYDFDPRRKAQNQWWFVQGMPVLKKMPKDILSGMHAEKPVEDPFDLSYMFEALDGLASARVVSS